MRRMIIGGLTAAAILAGVVSVGVKEASASKPFKKVTDLGCKKCHTSEKEDDMSEKDLTACGKASMKALEAVGYKHVAKPAPEAKQLEWAKKGLAKFKCP
jgi:Holliday junction resolvasome RuvABC DNA-binding subunit